MPPTSQKRLNPDCVVALANCKSTLENSWVKEMTQKGTWELLWGRDRPCSCWDCDQDIAGTPLEHRQDIAGTSFCPWLLLAKLQHPSNPGHSCFQPSHIKHPWNFALWRSPKTFTQRDEAKKNPNHPKTRDNRGKALETGCP